MLNIKGRKVSEETAALALEKYFAEHPEKEEKFKPIQICCLAVRIDNKRGGLIIIESNYNILHDCHTGNTEEPKVVERLYANEINSLVQALQSARDFVERNKS